MGRISAIPSLTKGNLNRGTDTSLIKIFDPADWEKDEPVSDVSGLCFVFFAKLAKAAAFPEKLGSS